MKDFLEFLKSKDHVPQNLSETVQKDIQLSFRKKEILRKFMGYYFLGAVISLAFCPQFGIGLSDNHGIAHYFRSMGDWVCAAFCGSLFLSAGLVAVFMNMKLDEINWVWSRYKAPLFFLPAISWSGLMLFNVTFQSGPEALSYHVSWIAFAMIAQMTLMKGRLHEIKLHP